jgi:predicted DNA-binding WGR domain protein
MRRTASEVIRNLEMRIARLERVAKSDGPVLNAINSSNAYHHPMQGGRHTTAMLFNLISNKRWEAVVDGNVVIVSQGLIDSKTKTTKKTFDDPYDAKDHFKRILAKKLDSRRERWTSAFNARDGEVAEDRILHGPSEIMYGRYPTPNNLQERYLAIALPAIESALDEIEGMAIPALMEDDLRSGERHIQNAYSRGLSRHNHTDLANTLYAGLVSAKQNLMSGLDSDLVIRDLSDLVDQIRSKM